MCVSTCSVVTLKNQPYKDENRLHKYIMFAMLNFEVSESFAAN